MRYMGLLILILFAVAKVALSLNLRDTPVWSTLIFIVGGTVHTVLTPTTKSYRDLMLPRQQLGLEWRKFF